MDTPALEHLVGAYFHQDWVEEYDSVEEAVVDFATGEPTFVRNVPAEIEQVLAACPEESDLQRFLTDELGTDYYAPPEEGGYRGWLLQLKALVEAELARPTAGRARRG